MSSLSVGINRHHFDRACELVLSGDFDLNAVFGQQFAHPIRPFDDADTISIQILFQPKGDNIFQPFKPIEIDMVNWDFSRILVDEDIGGTVDGLVLIDASTAGNALRQTGFPDSQVTDECDNIAGVQLVPNLSRQFLAFLRGYVS